MKCRQLLRSECAAVGAEFVYRADGGVREAGRIPTEERAELNVFLRRLRRVCGGTGRHAINEERKLPARIDKRVRVPFGGAFFTVAETPRSEYLPEDEILTTFTPLIPVETRPKLFTTVLLP